MGRVRRVATRSSDSRRRQREQWMREAASKSLASSNLRNCGSGLRSLTRDRLRHSPTRQKRSNCDPDRDQEGFPPHP